MNDREEKVTTIGRHPFARALLLQSLLYAEGIDSFLAQENLIQPTIAGGVEIKVRAQDIERALKIIEAAIPAPSRAGKNSKKISLRRILVPVDFSEQSVDAVRLAIGFAGKSKADIRLLHVYYNPMLGTDSFDSRDTYQLNLAGYLHKIEQDARSNMDRLVNAMKEYLVAEGIKDVTLSRTITNGIASHEIIEFSEKFKPGIIVMGTRGIGHRASGTLGSVTAEVIEKSNFPVFAIPDGARLPGIEDLKAVLFATDFDPSDELALERLIHFLSPLNVRIYCHHISVGVKKPWEKLKMDDLKEYFNKEFPLADIHFGITVSDTLMNGMEIFLRNNPVDLLAVTIHKRGFFSSFFAPSITKRIFTNIPRPLLVFRSLSD
ncbi:MAG: universal stress protein [Bacteroidota bacterium]